jgi:hypothetical protein
MAAAVALLSAAFASVLGAGAHALGTIVAGAL